VLPDSWARATLPGKGRRRSAADIPARREGRIGQNE
jgi:hypothetical protein